LKSSAIIGARFLMRIASGQLRFSRQLRRVEAVVARAQRGRFAMPLNVAVDPFTQGNHSHGFHSHLRLFALMFAVG
jgi:hypothetical protein